MDRVKIIVPSSSANVGLGYDAWCLGLEDPLLETTYTRLPKGKDIEIEAESRFKPPAGRILGEAGKKALQYFLRDQGIKEGAHLLYEDSGYPVGGLGRSGAEAVGAVMAAAVLYGKKLTRNDVIFYSGFGEAGADPDANHPGHLDNVAASTNGRFNIVAKSRVAGRKSVDVYDVPENLGVVIGFSSHKKTMGTEGMRAVLKYPVLAEDYVEGISSISAATAALVTGNIDRFLELVWTDRFHEHRRADIRGYGDFTASEFATLKKQLFGHSRVALNVSGAGPNMQFLYNKRDYMSPTAISHIVEPWFTERGITMEIRPTEVAKIGAYDFAVREYNYQSDIHAIQSQR